MEGLSDRIRRVERILGLDETTELKQEVKELVTICNRLERRIEFLESKIDGDNMLSSGLGQVNTYGAKEARPTHL